MVMLLVMEIGPQSKSSNPNVASFPPPHTVINKTDLVTFTEETLKGKLLFPFYKQTQHNTSFTISFNYKLYQLKSIW